MLKNSKVVKAKVNKLLRYHTSIQPIHTSHSKPADKVVAKDKVSQKNCGRKIRKLNNLTY